MKKVRNIFFWILCLAMLVFLKVGFIFFLLGFLPTIVTYFIDDSPRKDFYKSVRACNFTGMVPTVSGLIGHEYPAAQLQLEMTDPSVWLLIYTCAAGGWILVWLCRGAAFVFVLAASETRIKLLEKAQKDLVAEWGEEITQRGAL